MKTLKEIEERLSQIRNELNTRAAQLTDAEITTLETEVTELTEQRAALIETAEKRKKLLERIAAGEPIDGADGSGEGAAPTVLRNFKGADGSGEGDGDKYGSMKYRKAFMQYVCRGAALPKEYRADAISSTTDVGATIPTTVLNQIVERLESTGMILALVTRTAYKGGVSIPVSTVKPTATWVNEGAGSDKQKKDIKKDGMITFAYHKLRCAVAVSLEVDTMAISAFETLLINNIVEAMTKAIEQAIIDGDGVGKPKGILAETPAEGQEVESAAPSYNDLIAAEAALPQAYENGAVWCMSKKTFMQYYGLTDTNGQPIGRVNYGIAGKPERSLLGRPVVCCDYVKSYVKTLAAGTAFGFLFNFKDYVLNTNYAMGVKKYEDNETDDMVTKGIMLADGKVVDKNSLVTLKKIASV
ncbi:phage major capsid protein [Konateibacter massiliensis]|uniref:phage major capsid protein n=1 Tax=Konateibacter massiliensis TaxID=2002841 RepID=UPI000C157AEA|nr:phage major capsid protein [Konateibacter massiliensis]